jgi:hypothetical protein
LNQAIIRDMKEPSDLSSAIPPSPVEAARQKRRRRVLWSCVLGWTTFAGLALTWLLHSDFGPSVWIIHQSNPLHPAGGERALAWLRADVGFQHLYPWVFLGPYVALLAWFFPLERSRLRLSLPLHLAACVLFLAACRLITESIHLTVANVTFRMARGPGGQPTNIVHVQVFSQDGRMPLNESLQDDVATFKGERTVTEGLPEGSGTLPKIDFPEGLPRPPHYLKSAPVGFHGLSLWATLMDLVAFGAVLGFAHSVHFYRRLREREHRAVILESNLTHARLNALRAQLQPHFLFNSLNAVAALLRRDPRLAESTLMSLSELLRLTLSQHEKQEVPLRDELHFLQRYLEIQQTRFGDRLHFEQQIEPAALDCSVPTLLLQPLVENAVRHGLEPSEHAGWIRLSARQKDGHLLLTVEDDGVGLNGAHQEGPPKPTGPNGAELGPISGSRDTAPASVPANGRTGIGLANLRARLQGLYGTEQTLQLQGRPEGGARVWVELPWRVETAVPAAGS